MTDDAALPRKQFTLGPIVYEITEPLPVPILAVDVFLDLRVFGGAVHLTFASLLAEGSGPREARVQSRLRISLDTLAIIQASIERIITDASDAAKKAKETAN